MNFGIKKIAAGTLTGFMAISALFTGTVTATENPTVSVEVSGNGSVTLDEPSTGDFFMTNPDSQSEHEFTEGTVLNVTVNAADETSIEELWIDGIPQSVQGSKEYRTTFTVPSYSSNIRAMFAPEISEEEPELTEEAIEEPTTEENADETAISEDPETENVAELQQFEPETAASPDEEPVSENQDVKARKEIAEKLGVTDYVDADGYLTEDFWQTHDIRLLNLEDWAALFDSSDTVVTGNGKARTRSADVRVDHLVGFLNTPMPWGGTISNSYFSMTNGQIAFCGNGLLAAPQPDTPPTSDPTLVTSASIRKVLYHGYNGPDNRLTGYSEAQQVIMTSEFLSYANTGKSIGTEIFDGYHWNGGLSALYSTIQSLPTPPSSYKVYKVEFADSSVQSWTGTYKSQPLFYGVVEPDKGNAALKKESSVPQIQGNHYSLEGAEYGIYHSESDAKSDKNRAGTLTTDKNGDSNTLSNLNVGTFYVKEVKAPAGYKLDPAVYPITVSKDQTTILNVADDPMLGELLIHKIDNYNQSLAGAEFTLTNNSGNEIWFDRNENGKADDGEIIKDGAVVTTITSDESGNCSVKGLSFGSYQLEETKFPAGYNGSREKMDIVISETAASVSIEVTNQKIELRTKASSENGTHEQQASGTVTLKDTISYSNVNVGEEYVVKGILMNKETGETLKDADGKEITAEATFTAEKADGEIEVEFTLNASGLAGIQTVVFENLYLTDGTLIASHEDLNDEDQTIAFIDIKTEASSENGSHDQQVGKVTVKDTVSYTGLKPGKEYVMSGMLMNKETEEPILDKEGNKVVSDVNFIPEEADGEVVVEFTFDASLLAGTTTVVFEDLKNNGVTVAIHHDINDEDQTINFIDIKTEASSENGSHEQQASGTVTLKDTISYTGLTPGKEYTVNGVLMDKETGLELLDKDGKMIMGTTRFTAEKADGEVDVEFTLNASDLAGKDIVVFEELLDLRTVIAEHKDINDENQTITFIDIKTEALADNGSHVQINKQDVILKDTVTYTGLTPGQEYRLSGKLMNKETGEPMKDSDGKEIFAETVFTPENSDGDVIVEFRFNAVDFENLETVVFEKLYRNDIEIAVHEDLTDEDQSVSFRSYSVLVNKVDSGTGRNITNSKFEFTAYSDPECKNAVRTVAGDDKTGTALFDKLASGTTLYIKETKAPLGYLLSDEIVKVQVKDDGLYVNDEKVTDTGYLHSIVYKNTLSPKKTTGSTPPTGTQSGLLTFAGVFAVSAAAIAVLLMKKRK